MQYRHAAKLCQKPASVFAASLAFTNKSLSADHDFTAIGKLDCFGGAFHRSVPAWNAAHRHGFSDIRGEIGPNGSGSLHRDGGSTFENPSGYFAGRVLGIYPKIGVRIFPLELRESAGNVEHLAAIIFRLKSVMRQKRQHIDGQDEEQKRYRNNSFEHRLHNSAP